MRWSKAIKLKIKHRVCFFFCKCASAKCANKSVLLLLQRLIFELTCYFQLNLVLGKNCIFFLQIFHVKVNIARDPGYLQLPWVRCASVGNPTTRIPNSSVRPRPSQKFVCNGSRFAGGWAQLTGEQLLSDSRGCQLPG